MPATPALTFGIIDRDTLSNFRIAATFDCTCATTQEDAATLAEQAKQSSLAGWMLLGQNWTMARLEGTASAIVDWHLAWHRCLGANAASLTFAHRM